MDIFEILIWGFLLLVNIITLFCVTDIYSKIKDVQRKMRILQHDLEDWRMPEDGNTRH